MTNLTQKYPKSIAAGMALEGGVWAFSLALAEEVAQSDDSLTEVCAALEEAGVTSSSGEPYKKAWIGHLVQVGTFVCSSRDERSALLNYPVRRVIAAATKHDWDAEAMFLTLQANGTLHEIAGTSPLGKPDLNALITEADRLTAADRAAIATALVSEDEVKEAILRSAPMAREQFIIVGGEIARQSVERSERRMKETFPSHAASDAADEISNAANHLNNALAEIIQWNVTLEHDRLRRVQSALLRVERATEEINEALGRVTAA